MILYLSEQALTTPSSRMGIVNVNVVILRADGFLHEWFIEHDSVDLNMVF
jgi:hypothetical protein